MRRASFTHNFLTAALQSTGKMNGLLVCVLVLLVITSSAFQRARNVVHTAVQRGGQGSCHLKPLHAQTGTNALVAASTLVSIFGIPLLPPQQPLDAFRSPLAEIVVPAAHADFRAAQKRTYFRYVPKFTEGTFFWLTCSLDEADLFFKYKLQYPSISDLNICL